MTGLFFAQSLIQLEAVSTNSSPSTMSFCQAPVTTGTQPALRIRSFNFFGANQLLQFAHEAMMF
jgi:hypothetical protein